MSSLLRTRLTQDLRIRNYSEKSVSIYVRCVAEFAKYFKRSPESLKAFGGTNACIVLGKV